MAEVMATPAKKKKNKPKVNLKARPDTTPQGRANAKKEADRKAKIKKMDNAYKEKAAKPVDKAKERAKEAAKMKKIKEQSGY